MRTASPICKHSSPVADPQTLCELVTTSARQRVVYPSTLSATHCQHTTPLRLAYPRTAFI
jgi:hypothetical protein